MSILPSLDLENQRIASEIGNLVANHSCLAWIGSGLSVPEYVGWSIAVAQLCDACGVDLPGAKADLLDVAERCKKANPDAYEETLCRLFGRKPQYIRDSYFSILNSSFRGFITTNVDPLLIRAANRMGSRHDRFIYPDGLRIEALQDGKKPFFYIHGCAFDNETAPSAKNLVFSTSEFTEAYQFSINGFLDQILPWYSIVFLGCGLTEEPLRNAFSRLKDTTNFYSRKLGERYRPPKRICLMPERETNGVRDMAQEERERKELNEYSVEVFRYSSKDNHKVLDDLLEYLENILSKPGIGQEVTDLS